jgi:hypothetical protein
VPARQALVVSVVDPDERTAAAAYTTPPAARRVPGARCAPRRSLRLRSGALRRRGAAKSAYDLAFFAAFSRIQLK